MSVLRLHLTVLVGAALLASPPARAAGPSKTECLSASDAWVTARRENHLHDARAQLLVCASAACPKDVREECARHVAEVNAAIPSLVFVVKDPSGADLPAVTVTMDGRPLADRIDGSALELDPGEHTFRFVVPGQPPVDKTLVIHQGEAGRRETVVVGSIPPPPVATAVPAPSPSAAQDAPVPVEADHGGGLSGGRIAALGLLGIGIAGGVVGTVFGLSASSKWSNAKSDCGGGCGPTSPAQAERTDAQNAATLSTVGFVAGGVGLAAAATLWLVSPGARAETHAVRMLPAVGPSSGGLSVAGSF